MKILFLTQSNIDLNSSGIYSDLVNALIDNGHKITMVIAHNDVKNSLENVSESLKIVGAKVGEQFGARFSKKALVLLSIERKMIKAIKKYLNNEDFDLVLYATPPITFANVLKYCKEKFGCKSYLMLKDIFPQNAVDIGLMSKTGLVGLLYKYFKRKELKLYKYSDKIGCMSQANIDYLLINSAIDDKKLEIFPNSLSIKKRESVLREDTGKILEKYGIPTGKLIFLYGGNLGKPQGIDFFMEGIKACREILDAHFVIAGAGSEQHKLYKGLTGCNNATCLDKLAVNDYNMLCDVCDVGLVILDHRFTIPNYPSRTLSYMEHAKPILACTDKATDIKELVLEQAQCGKWCFSNNIEGFKDSINWFVQNKDKIAELGENGRKYFEANFDVNISVTKLEKMVNN